MRVFFVLDNVSVRRFLRERLIRLLPSFLGAGASVTLIAAVAFAATTINDNISTGGTLSVTGNVYASSTLQATGNAFFYGNVGIGTTTPTNTLHIFSSTSDPTFAIERSGLGNPYLKIIADASLGGRDWQLEPTIDVNTIGGGKFTIYDNTVTESPWWNAYRLVIDGSGRVGIGNAWPTYKLDVSGSGHFTSFVDAANFVATSTSVASTFAYNVGIGTTSPTNIISASSAATTTLYLDSTAVGTCIQMRSAGTLKRPVKIFFDDSGNMKSELGSC